MGKSKFPGKPSKSQNKKYISVLTGEVICEGDVSITNDKLSVLHKTFSDQDVHSIDPESPLHVNSPTPECNDEIKTQNMQKESRQESKSSIRIKNQQTKDDKDENTLNKKIKKSVTFRRVLESYSDSVGNKKKKPFNNHNAPLISIIKKSSSIYKSEGIVKPSKLSDISSKFGLNSNPLFNQKKQFEDTKDKEFCGAVGGFALPIRSAHSSRVIKPNKRFIETEDVEDSDTKIFIKKPRLPLLNDEAGDDCDNPSSNDSIEEFAINNNSEISSSRFLWHSLRPNVDKLMFSKKLPVLESAENDNTSDQGSSSDSQVESSDDEDAYSNGELEPKTVLNQAPLKAVTSLGKNILRKARLQLQDTIPVGNDGPFSSSISLNNTVSPPATITCGVCGAVRYYRFAKQARKFGIYSCESCRKFISKMVRKQTVTSLKTDPVILQCHKGDGLCHVPPIVRSPQWKLLTRCAYKARCPACWLKMCLRCFEIQPTIQSKLITCLPQNMREAAMQNLPKLEIENNPPTSKLFPPKLCLPNLEQENNNQKIFDSTNKSAPKWSQELVEQKDSDIFPPVIKDINDTTKLPDPEKTENSSEICEEEKTIENKRRNINVRVRKKTEVITEVKPAASTTIDTAKRQRIDLKGPRVKHVCRSASIVLGQPLATFSNDGEPETPDTPETPETIIGISDEKISEPNKAPEILTPIDILPEKNIDKGGTGLENTELKTDDKLQSSPLPSVDINKIVDIPEESNFAEKITDSANDSQSIVSADSEAVCSIVDKIVTEKKIVDKKSIEPDITTISRKAIRNINSVSYYNSAKKIASQLLNPISVDFWENYDPVEVNRAGFGLIGSDFLSVMSICFLCGASGTGDDKMIYCVCCCQPYHRYCVEDNIVNFYYGSSNGTELMETSMLDCSINSLSPHQNNVWRFNWLCPRCTVCQVCSQVSGSKLNCRKCHRSYHSKCVKSKSNKQSYSSDRPWICPPCLKCKSCGSASVAKYVGNMPLCSGCFKLRQKGSFCPLCQKCYEDNDFNTKMMECGECKRWIHAHCEGLSDEKYQLLSILPESIEFVCRKCFVGTNSCWRDAIDMELKNGFQTILRALSKNRDACALLKWSPRKKSICSCQPIISAKNIKFHTMKHSESSNEDLIKCNEKLSEYSISTIGNNSPDADKENECKSNEAPSAMDLELQNAISSIEFTETYKQDNAECEITKGELNKSYSTNACCCGFDLKNQAPSLLDIKRKVLCSEYSSLLDFNKDMIKAIEFTNCENLYDIYNNIVHDSFPWFISDSKLSSENKSDEEFEQNKEIIINEKSNELNDQEVPYDTITFDGESYFYDDHVPQLDLRLCLLCKGAGDGLPSNESRLLYCGLNEWVHANCALWSAEVFEEIDGSLQNVHSAISRGKLIRCTHCHMKGASVGCCARNCSDTFHYPCARNFGCAFMDDKTVYCPQHISENVNKKSQQHDKDFEINRPVYVELDRKKKKILEANRVQLRVGSLHVKNLGKFVPHLSDTSDAIVPINFVCSRMFWSTKEPWKIVEYSIKTSVFIKKTNMSNTLERNFTVDHSQEVAVVQCNLNEIKNFHRCIEDSELSNESSPVKSSTKNKNLNVADERSVKIVLDQLIDTASRYEEEICDEEPQNTADLLSPELEDEIYEDLQDDLLDGISMLDLFPKLMNYEDFVSMDGRDGIRDREDNTENRFDAFGRVRKDVDSNQNDNWFDYKTSDLIDDLFSSSKSSKLCRELKRSKSEVLPHTKKGTSLNNRVHQRSCSLSWNYKLDGNPNLKRRKVTQNRNPFSLSVDSSQSCQETKKLEITIKPNNENKFISEKDDFVKDDQINKIKFNNEQSNETFPSNTNNIKAAALEKIKISQLDGTDDTLDGSDYGSPAHQMEFNSNSHIFQNNFITNEIPVKCNRCQCTYRNQDSFQRHLPSCESLTSESESEPSHSPDQGQETVTINQNGVVIMQNLSSSNAQFMSDHQQQNISNVSMQMPNVQNQTPISILPNFSNQISFNGAMIQNASNNNSVVSFDCGSNLQNVVLTPAQANIQFGQGPKQLFSHPQTIQIDPNQRQQQNVIQDQNITQFQQNPTNMYPMNLNQIQNQIQNNSQIIHALPNNISINQLQNHPTIVKTQNTVNYQLPQQAQNTAQPKIITFSNSQPILTQNTPQIQPFTIGQSAPMLNFTVNQPMLSSPQKKQLILPHTTKTSPKRQAIVRMPIPNNRGRTKTAPKVNNIKRPLRPDKPIITNQGIQLNRPLVIQQMQNQNPIIVQQLPNSSNVMSYVEAVQQQNSNVQFITVNPDNEFKQSTQYLTANPLVPGTFQLHTDQGNLLTLAPNGSLSVLPNMQLTQTQPTVLGTIIQPQTNGLQCGMLSESLLLQPAPLEMVTDANGCMYLTSQPMYYGLETIVQNTVMQSQQFVSTAMQGMLSSNSSFSATTTQVFQASKIEPIVEVPSGYVVVNNMQPDGIIQQSQQNLIQAIQPQNIQQNRNECINNLAGPSGIQTNNLPIQLNAYESIQLEQKPMQVNTNNAKSNMNLQVPAILLPKTQNQAVSKVLPGNNIQQPIKINIDNENKLQKTNTKDLIQQIHFGNKNIISDTSHLVPCSQNNMQFSQIHFNKQNIPVVSQNQVAVEQPRLVQKSQVVNPVVEPRIVTIKKKEVTVPVNKIIKGNINNVTTKANTHLVQPIQNKSMPLLNNDCNVPLRQPLVCTSPSIRSTQNEAKNQIQQIVQPIIKSSSAQCAPKVLSSNQIQLPNTMFVQSSHAGIPTNIVNPIQQVSSCVSNVTPARPMNRVLPMQTCLQKDNASNNKPVSSCVEAQQTPRTESKINNVEPTIEKPILEPKITEINVDVIKPQIEHTEKEAPSTCDLQKNISPLEVLQVDTSKPATNPLKVLNGNIKPKPLLEKSVTYKMNNSNIFIPPNTNTLPPKRNRKPKISRSKENDPKMIFEIHSQDGFTYTSHSISDLWLKVLEAVQKARKSYGLAPLPQESVKAQLGYQILGLDNNALRYLVEQLPDTNKCSKYKHRYHKPQSSDLDYESSLDILKENASGAIRCEAFKKRSDYDMFSWLASKHRQRPLPTSQFDNEITSVRRVSSTNLPIAMRYRYLKETSKESVGVFRSLIHGRGLFCRRDIELGEMVIEYAGEVIRATLTDKREKYYDGKGIGCYMFRIDDQFVVDATMRGNAARFINHSCEPNCYSKVIDVLGHKHIVIFALRRILQGEELTYDYKFPFEDVKIPCSCGSRKCRKYLN